MKAPVVPADSVQAADVERWLAQLGLAPVGSADRDGLNSWDLTLDGRARAGVRMTLILDRSLGLVCWVHYAPPLADNLRRVYRQLLRWNDELPFVKFGLADDDRPVLSHELPLTMLDRESVGLAIARLLAVCDLLYEQSAKWVDRIGRPARSADEAGVRLLNRYADQLGELVGGR